MPRLLPIYFIIALILYSGVFTYKSFADCGQELIDPFTPATRFGYSVAIDGDTMVVGAPEADLDSIGQSFQQPKGAAYVFVREGENWVFEAALAPESLSLGDLFGYSVAIYKNTVVVSAPGEDILVGSGDPPAKNAGQGAVYVFSRDGDQWTQEAKLVAKDGKAGDRFGYSVAIYGGVLVVGSPCVQPLLQLFGDSLGNDSPGAAYVFIHNNQWVLHKKLSISTDLPGSKNAFGFSVAITPGTIVVGAPGRNQEQGSAHIFVSQNNTWDLQANLEVSDGKDGDDFGIAVGIDGDTVVVGASGRDVQAHPNQGSAYVFGYDGAGWAQSKELLALDGGTANFFGQSVSIKGAEIAIGAPGHDENEGAIYGFKQVGNNWSFKDKIMKDDENWSGLVKGAFVGYSVAIGSQHQIVIGAPWDDVLAPNGLFNALDAGSVYTTILCDANNDEYEMEQGNWLSAGDTNYAGDVFVYPNGLFGNDQLSCDAMEPAVLSGPLHGSLDLQPDGTFLYKPEDGFVGVDEFEYKLVDNFQTSSNAKVSIIVKSSFPKFEGEFQANPYLLKDTKISQPRVAKTTLVWPQR